LFAVKPPPRDTTAFAVAAVLVGAATPANTGEAAKLLLGVSQIDDYQMHIEIRIRETNE